MRDTWKRMSPLAIAVAAGMVTGSASAKDDFPPFDQVASEYTKVISTADGSSPMYTIWTRQKDGQVLAELPRNFDGRRFYITPTIEAGDTEAGVDNFNTLQVYWRRIDNQMVLIEPNLAYRSTGDAESQASTKRVYTDRVVLSTPIVTMGPGGGPVIDLDQVCMGQATTFIGPYGAGMNQRLSVLKEAKAFPYNIELTFEAPRANGRLMALHYSLGDPPRTPGFRPRQADRRVGYFYTDYTDRAANDGESQKRRLAHRWAIEKRDPSLTMSPPKEPIVYYIEHTTPVRYRRWVRDAILSWNKAFEQVGILNAIEVRQQDAQTGAYMDIDPEDMRYSFIRWTNSHMGYAIGPSNAHPDTGEIYNADIVMDESFIGTFADTYKWSSLTASAALGDADPETLSWLADNPEWDPRWLMATPSQRAEIERYYALVDAGEEPQEVPVMLRNQFMALPHDPALCDKGLCAAGQGQGMNVALARLAFDAGLLAPAAGGSTLDGLPEDFIGPMIRWVLTHEVGHTLGLMHNWKGSSVYAYAEANSEGFRGQKPWSVSVMDYPAQNVVIEEGGLVQGDWAPIDIGPYDMWAIKWGYCSSDAEAAEIAKQAANPEHAFMSDEGTIGPDPHARTWDFGENSLDFCDNQIRLVRSIRAKLLTDIVKDGDSWQRARNAYQDTLFRQTQALSLAAGWIGGAHVNRFHKGDPDAPDAIRPVAVDRQRRALAFIIENGLREQAFGFSPELLAKLGNQQWWDEGAFSDQPDLPVHDQILSLQASALTMLMNPTRLRRVIDNEVRIANGEDALTVPEVLRAVRTEVWSGMDIPKGNFTDRNPFISSFRRNLQREHVTRLIDLAGGRVRLPGAAGATIPSLARLELREVKSQVVLGLARTDLNTYCRAHLTDCAERIDRALDAQYLRQD